MIAHRLLKAVPLLYGEDRDNYDIAFVSSFPYPLLISVVP